MPNPPPANEEMVDLNQAKSVGSCVPKMSIFGKKKYRFLEHLFFPGKMP